MIVLEMKCPQLSKPEVTAARNENSIGDRMKKKKKTCFDCLTPYTVILWNRDIFWDNYHTVKISYRYNPTCVAPNNGWENSSRPSRGLEA